jgi:hypothetical protein
MKREVPTGAIVVAAVVVVLVVGGLFWRGIQGPPEFKAPPTSKVIPKYIWDGMKPDQQAKMKEQGYEPGDVKPSGPQASPVKR